MVRVPFYKVFGRWAERKVIGLGGKFAHGTKKWSSGIDVFLTDKKPSKEFLSTVKELALIENTGGIKDKAAVDRVIKSFDRNAKTLEVKSSPFGHYTQNFPVIIKKIGGKFTWENQQASHFCFVTRTALYFGNARKLRRFVEQNFKPGLREGGKGGLFSIPVEDGKHAFFLPLGGPEAPKLFSFSISLVPPKRGGKSAYDLLKAEIKDLDKMSVGDYRLLRKKIAAFQREVPRGVPPVWWFVAENTRQIKKLGIFQRALEANRDFTSKNFNPKKFLYYSRDLQDVITNLDNLEKIYLSKGSGHAYTRARALQFSVLRNLRLLMEWQRMINHSSIELEKLLSKAKRNPSVESKLHREISGKIDLLRSRVARQAKGYSNLVEKIGELNGIIPSLLLRDGRQ
ncbi:MAG: hypothetical protein NTZ73_04210 [Candidatus Diapherotrites archaeon]|nr:hypothetical protein [Candidatus Diapherotrites archaeon]